MVGTVFSKIRQFKNLIMLLVVIVVLLACLLSDPLGYFVARAKYKAQIMNEIAIENAETAKKIAIIKAETEAELLRIKAGGLEWEKN